MDSEVHRRYTGVGNELILANLRRLAVLRAPLTIRVPVIPGYNATPENMRAIAAFARSLRSLDGSITGIDLLPYHRLGAGKYTALGRDYPWAEQPQLDEVELSELARVLAGEGLQVNVGG
jgi:pyruvate formate lyase activating enzyme